MNSSAQQPAEINLKDLLFVILKRIWIVVVVGVVLAAGGFCYKYNSQVKDVNVLDISTKLDGESDYAYSERIIKVNRAKDIVDSINAIDNQIANQREYVSKSIYMQIDPMNEAVTTAQLLITIENNNSAGMDYALLTSYSQDIKAGGYLAKLSEEFATEQECLKELVRVEYEEISSVVVNTDESETGSAGIIVITVIGPNSDYTEKIMDCILSEVDTKCIELNESVIPHTVTLSGRQNFYMVDTNTRDIQNNASNRFGTLQKQIDTYDKSLEDLAPQLGVDSKTSIYAYFSCDVDSVSHPTSPLGSAIKYAIFGFAGGVFIVLMLIVVNYVFGKKFSSQSKFFDLFPRVNRIGVAKPTGKRSVYAKLIDRKSGDDNDLSDEISNKLMAANIANMTMGMNKVLVTGTAESSKIKELVSKLNIKVDVMENFFDNPACLVALSEYDGIIIVEQRNYSDCIKVAEEINLISNANTKLVGAIVI